MENVKKEFDVFPLSLSFIIYQQFSTEIFILLSKINVIKSAFRAKQKYIMYVKRVDDRWYFTGSRETTQCELSAKLKRKLVWYNGLNTDGIND